MRPGFFKVEFEWPVACNGHRLETTELARECDPANFFYVVTPIRGPVLKKKAFDEFPGLFLQFASIQPTPGGALDFADKFGLLQRDKDNELIWWLQYRQDFAELVALKGRAGLHTMSVNNQLGYAKVLTLGLDRLVTWVGNPVLSPLDRVNRIFRTDITAEISWHGRSGGLVVQPRSLLAAMALQLGLWLGTENEYIGQCPQCGETWEYGSGTDRRASRRYCSEKCQDAARYRRKKAKLGGAL
jgi:hypothetical protein